MFPKLNNFYKQYWIFNFLRIHRFLFSSRSRTGQFATALRNWIFFHNLKRIRTVSNTLTKSIFFQLTKLHPMQHLFEFVFSQYEWLGHVEKPISYFHSSTELDRFHTLKESNFFSLNENEHDGFTHALAKSGFILEKYWTRVFPTMFPIKSDS